MARTLIALDAGTTGVTSVLYDESLREITRAYAEFEQHFPQPGWVEHESRDILDAVDATLGEVLEHPEAADVAGIGITNQRETIFAKDPAIDEALKRGIVWQGPPHGGALPRAAGGRLGGAHPPAHGLLLDPYFSASKIEWMLANHDGMRERAAGGGVVFCTVDALIVDHLTEQDVCATDPTNASRTMLFDIEKQGLGRGAVRALRHRAGLASRGASLDRELREDVRVLARS